MSKRALMVVSAFLANASVAGSAHADTVCTTIDEFNALMTGSGNAKRAVTLKYDVIGVNPADFAGSKGCLVDFHDTRCAAGAGATLKVYGPYEPPNTAHPAGTLKFEFGNYCCPAPPCVTESWTEPNASAQVFFDGSEQCTVTAWLDPEHIGYKIECGTAIFEGLGDNVDDLMVDQIAMLQRVDGGWAMPNAVSTANEVCYEEDDPPNPNQPTTMDVPVLEDVTVSPGNPTSVYPVPADLTVGSEDGEIYLKFDLSSIPGTVTKAEIFLHLSDDGSAAGDGGDAFLVSDTAWSETTLTWNHRPPAQGTSLARQSPIAADSWYSWDVSAAVSAPGVYSFAIKPQSSDANGAHFFAKESASSSTPYIHVEFVAGQDPGHDPPGGNNPEDPGGPNGDGTGLGAPQLPANGCGCRVGQRDANQALLFLGALGVLAGMRRRRRR
jgi:MYXO-CTERM domain-containing protein